MTTQHTHHEHSDVDAFVAEHPSVPEDTATSTAETTTPGETEAQPQSSSPELVASPAEPEARQESTEERQDRQDEAHTLSGEAPSVPLEPTSIALEEKPVLPIQEAAAGEPEMDIRPFTAFIEEFRQVEARINASVKESEQEVLRLSSASVLEPWLMAETPGFSAAPVAAVEATGETVISEAASVDVSEVAASVPEQEKEEAPSPAPVERPVSPLLRPTTRLRSSRHTRHRSEQSTETVEQATKQEGAETAESGQAPVEPTVIEGTATEAETPRPARRYRFDRPAANGTAAMATTSAPPSRPRVEESREKATNAQDVETPAVEPKRVTQEPAATESPAPPAEPSRRRGHAKEQQPVASEAPTPAAEVTPQPKEIAPEDLPPLEYSELQKASSRRRRRHRSGASSNGTAAAATPPAAPAASAPSPAPELPGAPNVPYSIVSGYTVNQMNQGHEQNGPFMGPEPSPARGSVLAREGRTGRAEALRSASPVVFPGRSSEPALPSSTSINHLANAVTQVLQQQTDRMVAELRRALQAPTNVSVTLPAFPSTERVGVFVDVANLLYSARTLRIAIDFGKLLDFLRGNRRLVRAQAYCPTSPQPGDEQMFLQAVKGLGYRITTKNYKTFSSGAKKADLDLDLCMDVVRLVEGKAVDCIVLVSGDSDFMPMLDYCSDHGVRVEVAAFDEAMSATLRQGCDLFVNLSMLEEIRAEIR